MVAVKVSLFMNFAARGNGQLVDSHSTAKSETGRDQRAANPEADRQSVHGTVRLCFLSELHLRSLRLVLVRVHDSVLARLELFTVYYCSHNNG